MNQAAPAGPTVEPTSHRSADQTPRRDDVPARSLPGVPQMRLTPQQQLEALRRVQAQAEQRVKLGMQLFKAAEAQTLQHRQLLEQIKAEQEALKTQVKEDVARSLHGYDQWLGQMDDTFTAGLRSLEARMDALQDQWSTGQARIEEMVRRSEALLDQGRCMMEEAQGKLDRLGAAARPATRLVAAQREPEVAAAVAVPPAALAPENVPTASVDERPPTRRTQPVDGAETGYVREDSPTQMPSPAGRSLYAQVVEMLRNSPPPSSAA